MKNLYFTKGYWYKWIGPTNETPSGWTNAMKDGFFNGEWHKCTNTFVSPDPVGHRDYYCSAKFPFNECTWLYFEENFQYFQESPINLNNLDYINVLSEKEILIKDNNKVYRLKR